MSESNFMRQELISLVIRLAIGWGYFDVVGHWQWPAMFAGAAALSYFTVRYMMKYLDPTHQEQADATKAAQQLLARLNIPPTVELSKYEMVIASNLCEAVKEGADWHEIGGCENVIRQLNDSVILPLRLGTRRHSKLIAPPKGVLLFGPPGCGKTLIAKAVARAANARFINLQVSILTDKWYGESQKLASAVFSLARKLQPVIIFIDEIDSFLRNRQSFDHEATAMMKAQFMSLWDGFFTDPNCSVVIMGATNRPQDVDKAILRRMPAQFHIPPPNADDRESILEIVLRTEHLSESCDLSEVARQCDGLVGSDLREVCRLAALARAKHIIETGADFDDAVLHEHPLTQESLLSAVHQLRYGSTRSHAAFSDDLQPD